MGREEGRKTEGGRQKGAGKRDKIEEKGRKEGEGEEKEGQGDGLGPTTDWGW